MDDIDVHVLEPLDKVRRLQPVGHAGRLLEPRRVQKGFGMLDMIMAGEGAMPVERLEAVAARIGQRGLGDARRIAAVGQQEYARSEEHTSELQSLMRNSYAVFCWKKNKHNHRRATRKSQQQST